MSERGVTGVEKSKYEQAVVIGRTQLAEKCATMTAMVNPSMRTLYFNIREERSSKAASVLNNLEYFYIEKAQIMEYLRDTSKKTLVFSIMNNYLFPRNVIENPSLEIINLHHALLPNHPGRNAEIWAIFEGDEIAGITWHMVTAEIDAGDIILQQQIKVTEHMTSFTLFRALNNIAIESFPEVLDRVMNHEKVETYPQPSDSQYRLRYAKERPADGILCLEWNIDKMYRFVRAMDYGILKIMGDPVVVIGEKRYTWKKYTIADNLEVSAKTVDVSSNEISIKRDGKQLRLIGIRQIG